MNTLSESNELSTNRYIRTRIKICGFTRAEDITVALLLGVDALGFVFYPPSKRYVSPAQASALCANIPAFASTVALFVNAATDDIHHVIHAMRPAILQFHGDESPEECGSYGLPYLKAFRAGAPGLDSAEKLASYCSQFEHAAGWLFDSYTPAYGGSGQTFNYALLDEIAGLGSRARPVILSGGLKQETVVASLQALKPWAVDVSSGVEDAPGVKSASKMRDFVETVHSLRSMAF